MTLHSTALLPTMKWPDYKWIRFLDWFFTQEKQGKVPARWLFLLSEPCASKAATTCTNSTKKAHRTITLFPETMTISSLRLRLSASFQGFCHLDLNCNSHRWWLLFHFQSFPLCTAYATFFRDALLFGIICFINHSGIINQPGHLNQRLVMEIYLLS